MAVSRRASPPPRAWVANELLLLMSVSREVPRHHSCPCALLKMARAHPGVQPSA